MTGARVRRVLRTVKLAISIVWEAGRWQLLTIVGASVVTSLAIAGAASRQAAAAVRNERPRLPRCISPLLASPGRVIRPGGM